MLGVNAHAFAVLAHPLKTDLAAYLGKEGVIGADAHVFTGMNMGAALPDQNVAGQHELPVGTLDAQPLGLGITAVFGGADALFVGEELNIYL